MAPKQLKPRYIAGADFHRFCQAKGVNANCLRCGKGEWELHDTEAQLGMAGLHIDTDGNVGRSSTPLITLSCTNCGAVWSVVRGYVQDWLDANPEGEGDE